MNKMLGTINGSPVFLGSFSRKTRKSKAEQAQEGHRNFPVTHFLVSFVSSLQRIKV